MKKVFLYAILVLRHCPSICMDDSQYSVIMDNTQSTPSDLFKAVLNAKPQEIKDLLSQGISLSEKDETGKTAFMITAVHSKIDIFIKLCLYAVSPKVYNVQQKNHKDIDRLFWKNAILKSKKKDITVENVHRSVIKDILNLVLQEDQDRYRNEFAEVYTTNQLNFIQELLLIENNEGKNAQMLAKEKLSRFFTIEWVTKELKQTMLKNNLERLKIKNIKN